MGLDGKAIAMIVLGSLGATAIVVGSTALIGYKAIKRRGVSRPHGQSYNDSLGRGDRRRQPQGHQRHVVSTFTDSTPKTASVSLAPPRQQWQGRGNGSGYLKTVGEIHGSTLPPKSNLAQRQQTQRKSGGGQRTQRKNGGRQQTHRGNKGGKQSQGEETQQHIKPPPLITEDHLNYPKYVEEVIHPVLCNLHDSFPKDSQKIDSFIDEMKRIRQSAEAIHRLHEHPNPAVGKRRAGFIRFYDRIISEATNAKNAHDPYIYFVTEFLPKLNKQMNSLLER